MALEGLHLESGVPLLLVEVGQHLLLELVLPVVDHQSEVVLVKSVVQTLHVHALGEPHIGGGLAGLSLGHHLAWFDQTEGVNLHAALHRLDGVHHHRHIALVQLLEGLLGVDVDGG